jgi:diaminohydroxyphosphoribosylaminopyrimidine deaminase/5-amino-6-(5-phosphoribosylamino)uracil reductase
MSTDDASLMREALGLARRSRPSPNPRVGALVVADAEIVGRGYHERPGLPHAERLALDEAGDAARGATLYVTLEPCCHAGRTGPCTDAILAAGVGRVVVGMLDPDERVAGGGIDTLRRAGVEVTVDVLGADCQRLLEGYTTHRVLGRPQVLLKAAISLDGMLATASGDSKWISSAASRDLAHQLRADADAVLVGVGTVIADDPALTVRRVTGPQPLRIVLDPRLRTPRESQLITTAGESPVLLVHGGADPAAGERLAGYDGLELLECATTAEGRIDPVQLAQQLGARGILSLLVEGGSRVHGSFIAAGVADRLALFVAPKLIGGGKPWAALPGVEQVSQSYRAAQLSATAIGDDLLIEGRLGEPPRPDSGAPGDAP